MRRLRPRGTKPGEYGKVRERFLKAGPILRITYNGASADPNERWRASLQKSDAPGPDSWCVVISTDTRRDLFNRVRTRVLRATDPKFRAIFNRLRPQENWPK